MEEDEKFRTIRAMKELGGSFVQSLAEAWARADPDNAARLEAAWPEYIEKYRKVASSTALSQK